jgi:hypothetical protein
MEVQMFRTSGEICISAPVHGFLYSRLAQYVSDTQHVDHLQRLDSDFEMNRSEVGLLIERMEADLRQMIRELRLRPTPDFPHSHLVKLTLFGETVHLYPRLQPDADVLALHNALTELVKAEQEGGILTVHVIPTLPSIQYRLLHALKRVPRGMPRDRLKDAVIAEYDRLLTLGELPSELRRELTADRDAVTDATVRDATEVLSRWNLLTTDPGDETMATEKLRRIKL